EDPGFPSGAFYAEIARRTPPGPPTRETVRLEPEGQAYSTDHITDDFIARLLEIASLPKVQEAQRRMDAIAERIWFPSLNRNRAKPRRAIDERALPVPPLVLWALNDVSAPLRNHGLPLFERIAARTPQAELHAINGAGHYVFREQRDAFHRA